MTSRRFSGAVKTLRCFAVSAKVHDPPCDRGLLKLAACAPTCVVKTGHRSFSKWCGSRFPPGSESKVLRALGEQECDVLTGPLTLVAAFPSKVAPSGLLGHCHSCGLGVRSHPKCIFPCVPGSRRGVRLTCRSQGFRPTHRGLRSATCCNQALLRHVLDMS